jgi:cell division protein FtsL
MLSHTVVLHDVDPKSLHHQIAELEAVQRYLAMAKKEGLEQLDEAVSFLHKVEDEMRQQVRLLHRP